MRAGEEMLHNTSRSTFEGGRSHVRQGDGWTD